LKKIVCLGLVLVLTVCLGILYVGLGGQLTTTPLSVSVNHQQITTPFGVSMKVSSVLMGLVLCSHEHFHHIDPPAVGRDLMSIVLCSFDHGFHHIDPPAVGRD